MIFEGHGFRPLTGTLLSKLWDVNVSLILETVSVPSRGLSYLNPYQVENMKVSKICFRPLTGTLLSKQMNRITIRLLERKFPSPHGDSLI